MTITACLIDGPNYARYYRAPLRFPKRLRRRRFARIGFLQPGAVYHCPAPTSRWFECSRPLPCTSHGLATVADALREHGRVLIPARRP